MWMSSLSLADSAASAFATSPGHLLRRRLDFVFQPKVQHFQKKHRNAINGEILKVDSFKKHASWCRCVMKSLVWYIGD
jgi:hypothetical protein